MEKNNDLYIKFLEEKVNRLERKERLLTYIYPHDAWIREDSITFSYDEAQRKSAGRNDKFTFTLKTIKLELFKKFIKSHAMDLGLYPWVCSEGGAGYFSTVIDYELYSQCFTVNLSKFLHKLIESDNELKLSLMADTKQEFHERNR